MHQNLLMIVARVPRVETTKTRLGATIGAERACLLYRAFLRDLAVRFTPGAGAALGFDVAWACTPAAADFQTALARDLGGSLDPATGWFDQRGPSLNDRLTNLFDDGFRAGYQRIAIIASDSPHLPLSTAVEAFAALEDHDLSLGRVADGGYYLIGLRRFSTLLIGLPMSTTSAADAVAGRAAGLGLTVREIAPSFDVDEASDLGALRAALTPDGAAAPATWTALHDLGLMPPLQTPSEAVVAFGKSD